jgi:Flp pilus assembly CpaE family ATPase
MDQKEGITEDQDGLLVLSPYEDIQAALQAVGVIEDLDPVLMDSQQAEMVKQIRLMALKITYQALWEIYEANLYASENNQPSQG